jgi:hypothetical protein
MSLRRTVAAPFVAAGRERFIESEYDVALSLDRDWFTPDEARELVDIAVEEGLLRREGEELVAMFDPAEVSIPEQFSPGDGVLQTRSQFERVLDAIVMAGVEKQTAVADINGLQQELGLPLGPAAVLYAHRRSVNLPPDPLDAGSDT